MKLANLLACSVAALFSVESASAESLLISAWGGAWRDAMEEVIGKRFTEQTGATLEYTTGNAVIRLNKEMLAQGADVPDVVFTTGHVGWLYKGSDLFEPLDFGRLATIGDFPESAKLSDSHVAVWNYVYTICYRSSLTPEGMEFTSWDELWDPRVAGMLSIHEIDPSHVLAVATRMAGVDPAEWEGAQQRLLDLKPSIKAFYSSDAMSQAQLTSGEAPIVLALASNCEHLRESLPDLRISIPEEGAVGTTDAIGIMKASSKKDLAYAYLNIVLDPQVQAEMAQALTVSPASGKAELPPEFLAHPGIYADPVAFENETIRIDNKLRSEKLGEWREWFAENILQR